MMTSRLPLFAATLIAAGCAVPPELMTALSADAGGSPAPTVAAGGTAAAATPARATADRPDDAGGYQVHALYVVPKDLDDRRLDDSGAIARSIAANDAWFFEQTGKQQRFRFDRVGGAIDVTYVKLAETDAEVRKGGAYTRDKLESILKGRGFMHPKKLYAVYYDGTHHTACADGPVPPGLAGNSVVMYLRAGSAFGYDCDGGYWATAAKADPGWRSSLLHELIHAHGFMPPCAGHYANKHTSFAPTDLMYAGDQPYDPQKLDGAGEIYGHGRADCLDLARSVFLTPTAKDAVPPPSWDKAIQSTSTPADWDKLGAE